LDRESPASQKRSGGNAYPIANLEVEGDKGIELLDLIELDGAIEALAAEDETWRVSSKCGISEE